MQTVDLERLKNKDLNEFKALAKEYSSDVFSVAYCILLSPAQAHLVAEKTFLRAYEQIDAFTEKADLSDWLCKIAYEEAGEYAKRINDPTVRFAGKANEMSLDSFYYSKNNKVFDIEKDVKLALSILPVDQREALLLHDGYGFGYDKLSYMMNVSPGIIRSRTGLARSGIKNILFKKWNV